VVVADAVEHMALRVLMVVQMEEVTLEQAEDVGAVLGIIICTAT
jgi:hypothetical protein